jgi:hypothetical protein
MRGRKLALVSALGGRCSVCGYSKNLAALCFHHPNPKLKVANPSAILRDQSVESAELRGLELLCHNCHAEIHHPTLMLEFKQ